MAQSQATLTLRTTSHAYRSRIAGEYAGWVNKARHRYGDKLDLIDVLKVDAAILAHFHGARIEVTRTYTSGETYTRRGRVGVTTGWKPALMLMHRTSDIGSDDLLTENDRLVRVVAM